MIQKLKLIERYEEYEEARNKNLEKKIATIINGVTAN